jgi:hypothetical protein
MCCATKVLSSFPYTDRSDMVSTRFANINRMIQRNPEVNIMAFVDMSFLESKLFDLSKLYTSTTTTE